MAYGSILIPGDSNTQALQRHEVAGHLAVANERPRVGMHVGFLPDLAWFYLMDDARQSVAEDLARRRQVREDISPTKAKSRPKPEWVLQ